MKYAAVFALLSFVSCVANAQTNPAAKAAREWRQQHERAIVDEFVTLLKVPNIASDKENIQRNAELIAAMFAKRGVTARLVSVPGGNPVVFGEIKTPGATRTIGMYAHYDGQPLDPKEWASPPFEPTLRNRSLNDGGTVIPLPAPGTPFDPESRLYGRATADDKAPIIAIVAALDALRAAGISARSNIKFMFEGEEEAGSQHLEATLAANKELFAADVWLMCDAPLHQTRRQSIIFGARGLTAVDITTYGPRTEIHSGHYGNWAPNPALTLAHLLGSMKDDNGRILIENFAAGVEPLSALEKRALAEAPDIDAELMNEMWLGSVDNTPTRLVELVTQPSMNIRGMASSRIGNQASNVIPATATATIDIRVVKGLDHKVAVERLMAHIRAQGFHIIDTEPDAATRLKYPKVAKVTVRPGGYNAARTAMDLPISQEIIRVVESARGPVIKLPTMGGGLPLESVERPLSTRTIIIPIGNHDNNQHGYDENLRIQNLWDGIELMAALLTM